MAVWDVGVPSGFEDAEKGKMRGSIAGGRTFSGGEFIAEDAEERRLERVKVEAAGNTPESSLD